jgi:TRAP transporter TAXI family solute receptor
MATQHPHFSGVSRLIKPLAVVIASALLGWVPLAAFGAEILVGTDAQGSFSHFTGRVLCRAINRSAGDLNCRVIPAISGTHNLTNLNGGSLDLALLDSNLLHEAVTRTGQFAFLDIRYDNLGTLMPLYRQPILLVARADANIGVLSDLKGKRINAGVTRSKVREAVNFIMTAKGWTKQDFKLVQELPATLSQDTMAFCHGSIEAMVHIGVHPDSKLEQLTSLCGALLVDMDDADITKLVGNNPALTAISVPAATYPGLEKAVVSFGTTILLVASGSLDEETVQAVMAALEKNQARLKNSHPALGEFSMERTGDPDIGISEHPGAAAYFSAQSK